MNICSSTAVTAHCIFDPFVHVLECQPYQVATVLEVIRHLTSHSLTCIWHKKTEGDRQAEERYQEIVNSI